MSGYADVQIYFSCMLYIIINCTFAHPTHTSIRIVMLQPDQAVKLFWQDKTRIVNR